jgi:hypothetical protein
MAKKPSKKAAIKAKPKQTSKAKQTTKAKVGGQRKNPAPTKRAKERAEKYEQPGAPWWKLHLP